MANLIEKILENKQSVRDLIDEAAKVNEDAIDGLPDEPVEDEADAVLPDDENEAYRHLFVRRFKKDSDKPSKRSKVDNASTALELYFDWANKYKQEKVEIWTDVATDAKNFYRYCLKNREQLEPLWKGSARMRKTGLLWPAAYKDIQARSRQSGNNLVGTLEPFNVDVQ